MQAAARAHFFAGLQLQTAMENYGNEELERHLSLPIKSYYIAEILKSTPIKWDLVIDKPTPTVVEYKSTLSKLATKHSEKWERQLLKTLYLDYFSQIQTGERVPFLIRLRECSSGRLPAPEDLPP